MLSVCVFLPYLHTIKHNTNHILTNPVKAMSEIYKFKVLEEHNLVIQYHQNTLTYNGLKNIKTQIVSNELVKSLHEYDTIVDIRKSSINCSLTEIQKYRKYISQCYPDKNTVRKVAILSDEPKDVAKATMFTLSPASDMVLYKIFSTMEGALSWLKRPLAEEHIVEETIATLVDNTSLKSLDDKAQTVRWKLPNQTRAC